MLSVPILRSGEPYYSKETIELTDYASGVSIASVSQANAGLISRDLSRPSDNDLENLKCADILDLLKQAARHFMESDLPVGETTQSPDDFVSTQSATTGLPHSLCRQNMKKIEATLVNMAGILDGLTGGLDLETLDAGFGERDGHVVSYARAAGSFGAILPANSPGVHGLWPPSLALKTPVVLKPGQREPWTPLRIVESLRAVGFPDTAFGFYPCGHDGAGVILRRCDRAMLFGAGPTVRPWLHDPRIEIHGPGHSKILLGPDTATQWNRFLDTIETSVSSNGGRSCINASSIRTTADGPALADALAQRLAGIVPLPRDAPDALLAAFADPAIGRGIDAAIERELAKGGAEDLSAKYRERGRLVEYDGGVYLLPTVILCDSADHPLANQEYLFPFVSVVQTHPRDIVAELGPSLVVTALTEERRIVDSLMRRSDIGRLNLGPIATNCIQWDQPHEGNIFTHLYQQRAFQHEPFVLAAS